jgi:outer membrane protein assembly factor BamB
MSEMYRGNLARTGEYNIRGIEKFEKVLWKFTTGDKISTTPALINGCLYFGGQDGFIYSLNAETGL